MSTPGRAPLGYFWGDDGYGLEAAATAFGRDAAAGGPPLTPWHVSGTTTRVAEIAERVATATLFGGGALVVVEDPSPLLRARADRDALVATLGAVAPGNALVFLEPTDGFAHRAKSLEDLEAAVSAIGGEVHRFIAPKEGAMARWIGERAAERRIAIEPAAADLLARRVGGFVREGDVNRRRQGQLAVAELEKLALYRLDVGTARRSRVKAHPRGHRLAGPGPRRVAGAGCPERPPPARPRPDLHARRAPARRVGAGGSTGDEDEGVPRQEALGAGAWLAPG